MRSSRVAAVIGATLLVVGPALGGCSADEEPEAETPTVEPTPLADFATEQITIARAAFCARVAPDAVEDALGGTAEGADEWVNGDRARVAPGVRDVVHEFGCRWRAADGTTVSGWVFAPPVTPGRAVGLRRAAAQAEGCRRMGDAPAFGSRSAAVRCDDGSTTYYGLFGDAWLSCSLTVAGPPGDDVLERAGRWCVTVAQAASA